MLTKAERERIEGLRLLVTCRSGSEELYNMSREFLTNVPGERLRVTGLNTWMGGTKFHVEVTNMPYDWVISLDEDAFVWDTDRMLRLLLYMLDNGYHICGYPEGGGVMRSRRKNPVVPNQFFNIINTTPFRPMTFQMVRKVDWNPEWEKFHPDFARDGEFHYCNEGEHYYHYNWFLLQHGAKTLYLTADMHTDRLSVLGHDHEGVPMLIHTFGGRSYSHGQGRGVERIWKARDFAAEKRKELNKTA